MKRKIFDLLLEKIMCDKFNIFFCSIDLSNINIQIHIYMNNMKA